MERRLFWLAAVWISGLLALVGFPVAGAGPGSATAPQDVVLQVSNDILFALVGEPEDGLRRALGFLDESRSKEVSGQINRVLAFVRLERSRASEPALDKLVDAMIALDALAGEAGKGSVSKAKLTDIARLTHRALAAHYLQLAVESWNGKIWQATGQHLSAAALHLRQGVGWSGVNITPAQQALLTENDTVAGALMDGPGCGNSWVVDAAAPQIDAMKPLIDGI